MIIKNQKELEILREGGKRLAAVLQEVAHHAIAGVSARELDDLAEKLILKAGGAPSFKGYKVRGAPMPYPGSLCVSINDEVVHGLPTDRVLKAGDVVGLDIGMQWEGLFTDTALTLVTQTEFRSTSDLNSVWGRSNKLIEATKKSLEDYKTSQMKALDDNIAEVTRRTVELVMAKRIDMKTHIELIYEALQQAKREKLIVSS